MLWDVPSIYDTRFPLSIVVRLLKERCGTNHRPISPIEVAVSDGDDRGQYVLNNVI